MLTIQKDERVWDRYCKAWGHALEMGLVSQFVRKLAYLDQYRDEEVLGAAVELGLDFAPHSFSILWKDERGRPYMNGGLIYQGPGSPVDGSFPSLTVSLDNSVGWFIHT